jgi:hypothetical protein
VLKLLQWQRRQRGDTRARWVLKCPQHVEQLPVLNRVFPDATVIFTHRDPVAVIQSTVTMQAYSQRIGRRRVDARALIDYWSDRVEHLLRAWVRDRSLVPAERSFDSLFHVFMADEMATAEQVYRVAGLELIDAARRRLKGYIDGHPRGKEGRVVYNLRRDFATEPAELRERFRFYFDRFPVRAETKS